MTDSDNILTATLAELKTYFEGWHSSNYDELHKGFSSSIDGIYNEINNIKNKLINEKIIEALRNYYNKEDSDARYLLGYKSGNRQDNSTYAQNNLQIQNNKPNKQAIVTQNEAGLMSPDMYETMMQLHSPTEAQGAVVMDEKRGHSTQDGKWLATNPVYDKTTGTTTNYTQYLTHMGHFTQMVRFGSMRTLNMLHAADNSVADGDPTKDYQTHTFLGLNADNRGFLDTNGAMYYLIMKIATEDEPVSNGFYNNVVEGIHLQFIYLSENTGKNDGRHEFKNYNKEVKTVQAGTWLALTGPKIETPNNEHPKIQKIKMLATISWIAKNIKE